MDRDEQDAYRDWLNGGRVTIASGGFPAFVASLSTRSRKAILRSQIDSEVPLIDELRLNAPNPYQTGKPPIQWLADFPGVGMTALNEVSMQLVRFFGRRLHVNHYSPVYSNHDRP